MESNVARAFKLKHEVAVLFSFLLLMCGAAFAQPPERLNVDGLGKLPAFSHASIAGDLIFVAGTLGTKADSFELVEGGVGPQTEQTLRNIERILGGAGATLRDAVKVNVYLTDMTKFAEMNEAYLRVMGSEPPARTTVGVTALALGALVEIECVAKLPSTRSASIDQSDQTDAADKAPLPIRTTGFVPVGGEQIYYESTGEGAPIVFCHGYGGNHVVWYQQVPEFARTHRALTWDQRGFGRSTNNTNKVDPLTAATDLLALIDHLKLDRVHLVGQSMGGWTVLAFALDHPNRVLSLTLADSIGGIYTPKIEQDFDAFIKENTAKQAQGPPPIGHHPALNPGLAERDLAKAFLYEQLGSLAPPASPAIPMMLRTTKFDHARLAEFRRPVLFIVGSEDNIFTPDMIRAAAPLLPTSRVIQINGAGHSAYFEQPDDWNRAYRDFLGSLK